MKRQSSSPTSNNGNSNSSLNTPAKRKRRLKQSWIFVIFQGLAIIGPLGFTANILYFHVYFHQSEIHNTHHEDHPLHHISKHSIESRYNHSEAILGKVRSVKRLTLLDGSLVLERMYQQALQNWKKCGKSTKATEALRDKILHGGNLRSSSKNKDSTAAILLEPFSFRDTLEKYLKDKNATLHSKNADSNNNHQDEEECILPQPARVECNVTTYSMVVAFQGEDNFRTLFMNLLSWVTYPSVSDIVILMPLDSWTSNKGVMDAKYKKRIKTWHETPDHIVTMIGMPNTIDSDPSSKTSVKSMLGRVRLFARSKALLFMDGGLLWEGNSKGVQTGFELWKQNPHSIVVSHKSQRTPSEMSLTCPEHPQGLDVAWAPFCRQDWTSKDQNPAVPASMDALYSQYQDILDLSGMFVHSDMLCLIHKPLMMTVLLNDVWKILGRERNETEFQVHVRMQSILAVGLLQVSGNPPLLYPPRILRPKNTTQHIHENWHFLPHPTEVERLQKSFSESKAIHQEVLLSMLGYFGSSLAANAITDVVVPFWCDSGKQPTDPFYLEDIPWIDTDGNQFKNCLAGPMAGAYR